MSADGLSNINTGFANTGIAGFAGEGLVCACKLNAQKKENALTRRYFIVEVRL